MPSGTPIWTRLAIAFAVAGLVPAASAGSAGAKAPVEPWRAADQVRSGLFDAGQAILLEDGDPVDPAKRAQAAYGIGLSGELRRADPRADRAATRALADSVRAAEAGDGVALASARGAVRAAIYAGSYDAALDALRAGNPGAASDWLLLREFRTATRFSRPGADGTQAVKDLAAGEIDPDAAALIVQKDLLDAYQARTREIVEESGDAEESGFAARRAERAALAAGYWQILEGRYQEERGEEAAADARDAFAELSRAAARGGKPFVRARKAADEILSSFTAAPFTPAEEARRAQQLLRFIELVPIEYGRGVAGGRVTLDFEIQEAIGFRDGGESAFVDLLSELEGLDTERTEAVRASLATLETQLEDAAGGGAVADPGQIQEQADLATENLEAMYPEEWLESSNESDLDLVLLTLDRLQASVGQADYDVAEQARLEAYAFFEFGPELYLRSTDPALAAEVEGLIWFGFEEHPGLANLIAQRDSAQAGARNPPGAR